MLGEAPLDPGVIQVLYARLDRPPLPYTVLQDLLSDEERARAQRYARDEDSRRHILGRALVRIRIGRLRDIDPGDVRIIQTEQAKPFVEGGPAFNISHSGDAVLVALAIGGRLGIDVEMVRPLSDLVGLATTSFARDELDTLTAAAPENRVRQFFRIWTRKEAMLKALGSGIPALSSISVSGDSGMLNTLRRLDAAGERVADWTVQSIPCDPDHEAAVAWDRPIARVACFAI
jgi:4'-phosphopantetheinyl transferase